MDFVTSHTNIAATLFDLAGILLREDFDGLPMSLTVPGMQVAQSDPRREHVSVESRALISRTVISGEFRVRELDGNNTSKAMRVIGDSYNLFYWV